MKEQFEGSEDEDLPPEVNEIIKGVNIFQSDLEPEKSADPMICDKNIKLTKCELAFLRRGPRFMLRQNTNDKDFCTELGKMIVKQKYDQLENGDGMSDTEEDDLKEEERKIVAESGLTYDKETKTIDMGKFKATNYKFNKFVHLPDAESIEKESKHEKYAIVITGSLFLISDFYKLCASQNF